MRDERLMPGTIVRLGHLLPRGLNCRIGPKSNIFPPSVQLKFIYAEHVLLRPVIFSRGSSCKDSHIPQQSLRHLPNRGESSVDKKTLTVIVVDGDESVRRAMKRLLMSNGYPVVTFESAEDLLQSSIECDKTCLLLDIRLPGISGLDLYAKIVSSGLKFPVIFMTAHDDAQWQEKAERAGAIAFLRKPFGEQSLLSAIALA
jgi:CheY-like chemotaxis protein